MLPNDCPYNVPLLSDYFCNDRLQYSVTLHDGDRFGSNYLHRPAKGLLSYILRKGSGRMDSRDIYTSYKNSSKYHVFGEGTRLQ